MKGYVYVLSNPSMPGLYKIGSSKYGGSVRARSLSASTSCPKPFDLVFEIMSPDCREAERRAHEILKDQRYNISREFFECEEFEAIAAAANAALEDYEMYSAHMTEQDLIDAFCVLSKTQNKPHPMIWAAQILLEQKNA